MIKNYTVAWLDILGFTNLVEKKPLGDVVNLSLGWFKKALKHSLEKGSWPSNEPTLNELQNHPHLGIAWFSDTILIYTLEDTDDCIRDLLSSVAILLSETMFKPETRLRCGISYGESIIDPDNSTFVGKPIIEAYKLESSQAWSGGALTESAVWRVPEALRSGEYADWPLIPYEVPRHCATPISTLAIDWTRVSYPHDSNHLPWSPSSAAPTEDEWKQKPKICEKWWNTKRFYDEICHICNPKRSDIIFMK